MARLLNWLPWRRRRMERDLERELRYHVDRRVEDLKRTGVGAAEARRQVALEFGGLSGVREDVRETWIWRWLDHLGRDLRLARRSLVRNPGFAATAMLSFALGIGANAAIFSLIEQALLRALPVHEPERLVQLQWRGDSLSSTWGTGSLMSYPLCRDLQQQTQFFEGVLCRFPTDVIFSTGKLHESVAAEIVSGSYFSVLGVRPERGRVLDDSDDRQPGARPVVVLSHNYWTRILGAAETTVGSKVLVNNHPMTVVGIAPAGFTGVDPLDAPVLWIPAAMKREATPEWDRLLDRRTAWMHVFGRLAPGVTAELAQAGLRPWFDAMLESDTRLESFPKATTNQRRAFLTSTMAVTPAARGLSAIRGLVERPLVVLMGGALVLTLLATLNVAGLLLARSAARTREVTTRLALGASRARITSQLLVESLILAVGGGFLGLVAAPAVSRVLWRLLPSNADVTLQADQHVLWFSLLMSLVTGVLCGLAPAWQSGRTSLLSTSRSALGSSSSVRFRKTLVVAQLAFALLLLVGAGLFVQTLARLSARDLGFSRQGLMMFRLEPDAIGYSEADAPRIMHDALRRLLDVPAVEHAVLANSSMLDGGSAHRILTIAADTRVVTERPVPIMRVGPGFFATVGATLVAGRDFTEADTRDIQTAGYRAVIVNESFARRYFGGGNPVGHRVGVGNQPNTATTIEIVGMVKDFSFRVVRTDDEPDHVFFPFADTGSLAGNGVFFVKTRGDQTSATAAVRAAIEQVDPRLPILFRTLDGQVDRALRSERMLAVLSSAFGAVALLLSAVGLFGVMSFLVTRRTQEISVRLALGATRRAAVWLVVRDALTLIAIGTAIAIPAAWTLRRLVETQLFGVSAFDGPTIAAAIAVLGVSALGATLLPAWRAASVNPTRALRLD